MVVAGDHANNDMAGEEEGTWKTTFEDAGYEVECVLSGLGEIPAIQDLYVRTRRLRLTVWRNNQPKIGPAAI